MDLFGIGQAMKGMAHVYFRTARRTGRTTTLIESLKDGDRVIFCNAMEANHFSILLKERGLDVECVTVNPREPSAIFYRGTPEGRTVLDHNWVEDYYLNALEQCAKDIDRLQREASGFGEAHHETRRRIKASEFNPWIL